jgi:hypothetical protein
MGLWRTHAYEKDLPRVFVLVAVAIGIGIAIAVDGHLPSRGGRR